MLVDNAEAILINNVNTVYKLLYGWPFGVAEMPFRLPKQIYVYIVYIKIKSTIAKYGPKEPKFINNIRK